MTARRAISMLGSCLTIAAVAYLAVAIVTHAGALGPTLAALSLIDLALLGCLAIGLAVLFLGKGLGWSLVTRKLVGRQCTLVEAIAVHGGSQILKYLPGNVFHYAGRQIRGLSLGWSQSALAVASVIESTLNVIAGVLVTSVMLMVVGPAIPHLPFSTPATLGSAMLVSAAVIFALVVAPRAPLLNRVTDADNIRAAFLSSATATAFAIYLGFFMMSAICLYICYIIVSDDWDVGKAYLFLAVYPISWLAGYFTPGAPAGLGVRETMIVLTVGGAVGQPAALAAAVSFRLVTIAGEILYYLFARRAGSRIRSQPPSR